MGAPYGHPPAGVEFYVPQSPTYGAPAPYPAPVNPSNICHFFNTPGGCRKGNTCPFAHVRYEWLQAGSTVPFTTPEEFFFAQQQMGVPMPPEYYPYPYLPMSPPPMASPPRFANGNASPPLSLNAYTIPSSPLEPNGHEPSHPHQSIGSNSESESETEEMSIEQRLFLAAQRYEREHSTGAFSNIGPSYSS